MASPGVCKFCTQLFTNPTTLDVMRGDGYTFSRGLNAFITSAESGCGFCALLQRSFRLGKFAHTEVHHENREAGNYSEALVTFRFEWYLDQESKIILLAVAATDLEKESGLVDWGLDGLLRSASPRALFKVMTWRDDPANCIITQVLPSPTLDLESRYSLAAAWKTKCDCKHGVCRGLGNGPLPTRILDLGSGASDEQVTLREDLVGHPGRYVCLSYCWGSVQDMTTGFDTINQFKRGISRNLLPKTIQDAIDVTWHLGIRYLWIDALCILQDSETDKARECSRMDQIYQRAYVTISAARADNCHKGFLGKPCSMATDLPRLPIHCPDGRLGSMFILPKKQNWFQDPIQTRAWTLQEHVLSPRLLIWSKYQLFWLCTNGLQSEQKGSYIFDGPYYRRLELLSPAPFDRRSGADPDESVIVGLHVFLSGRAPGAAERYAFQSAPDFIRDEMQAIWERAIVEYSKRRLSMKSDKLPALSGLASRFGALVQDEYLAGHWRRWLLPHLLWKCADRECGVRLADCPSWSWLSVDGPVSVDNLSSSDIKLFHPRPVATILDCKTTPLFKEAFYGPVISGRLLIRGYIKAVTADTKTRKFDINQPYNLTSTEQRLPRIVLDHPPSFWDEVMFKTSSDSLGPTLAITVWCLPLYLVHGLGEHATVVRGIVLTGKRTHYERVGWFFGSAEWCYKERSQGLYERDVLIL